MPRLAIVLRSLFRGILSRWGKNRFENGVYIWRNDSFEKVSSCEELFKNPGNYIIYFHNNLCPHCRRFHPLFISTLETLGEILGRAIIVRVVCDWFTSKCSDPDARKLFSELRVAESPKLVYVKIDAGGVKKILDLSEDISILRSLERLRTALLNLLREEAGDGRLFRLSLLFIVLMFIGPFSSLSL
jgi:thiol-disulfide isomerase/thioredoxin